jgi:SAM-dependent methyltransferase
MIRGPLITLGNQDIHCTESELAGWLKEEELPVNRPKTVRYHTGKILVHFLPQAREFIHAATFFAYLGIPEEEYFDVDKYDFDKPKILSDLEVPFEPPYIERFNCVLDGGTMEHLFDVKTAFENIARCLKVGGYVFHISPANNFLNHGFYQFSPTLFHDFYSSNGFEAVDSFIVETIPNAHRFYPYDHHKDYPDFFIRSEWPVFTCFAAVKKEHKSHIVNPVLLKYRRLLSEPDMPMDKFNRVFDGEYFDL